LNKTALIIPTYQAEKFVPRLLSSIFEQTLLPDKILIIDSSSTDKTIEKIQEYSRNRTPLCPLADAKGLSLPQGERRYQENQKFREQAENLIQIKIIPKAEFNHGRTRDLGIREVAADFYIFLTQDAILVNPQAFENLIACYQNPNVGCAYGRQLPHHDATLLASHARAFNYPETSCLKRYNDREKLGVKTYFNSDSFSSYRATAYHEAGGFPNHTILGEDAYIAAKMLTSPSHFEIAYCAEAMVYHSHNYSPLEEFKRYFDIGVFHAQEPWLLKDFSGPASEGKKYVLSELSLCLKQDAWGTFCVSILSIAMKLLGYALGKNFKKLPLSLCKKFSMHKGFWKP
jgi:rhamnosyltransferase